MIFIFDLDQTLIDSRNLEYYRDLRDWKTVNSMIDQSQFKSYEKIDEILITLKNRNFKIGLVTSSPASYANRIINKLNWKFDTLVCYHDTSLKKPNPDPILKALDNLNISKVEHENVFSFGDRDIDIIASKKAGVKSVACIWGTENAENLKKSNPDYIINYPEEILKFI
jgi:HAD superfamily hydrolase (TIGR01549 family)